MTKFPISKKAFSFGASLLLLLVWLANCLSEGDVLPAGNDRFGLCFISDPDHRVDEARYQGALAAGARWDRWPLYWHWVDEGGYVGPHPGGSHDYDTLVAQDMAHGLTPVVILLGTPARYAATPPDAGQANTPTLPPTSLGKPIFSDGSDTPGPGKTINPANAWAEFVFNTVDRYRPRGTLARQEGWPRNDGVRYWEVWNEPDFGTFWNGSVEEYYRLLEVAYKSIKTADPEATVILGGLAFYDQRAWFPELLRQTGGQPERAYFDVFSFHHYLSIYRGEWLIKQARDSLDAQGLTDIPIWITESGVSVWDDYPATAYGVKPETPYRGTMVEQAAYVIQNSALAFYNGVERYYHFMLHDDCGDGPGSAYGLRQNFTPNTCNPAEGKPRPAYAAYQLAAGQFRDLSPLWRDKQPEQDRVAFFRPDDRSRLAVLWATRGVTVTTTLTATGETAQLYWIDPIETPAGTTGLSRTLTLTPTNGLYILTLPPATNQNGGQADDTSFQIGGPPLIVVEQDTRPPHTRVQPLPVTSPPGFVLQWEPNELGSGVSGYDVFVSEGDGPFELWLEDTRQTEAKFTGQVDQTYRFAVRARDRAGNQEPLVALPQVRTRIVSGSPIAGIVLGPRGEPVPNANVTITGSNVQESAMTGEDGRWPPVPLLPGDYTLQASTSGYGVWPATHRITIDESSTKITTTVAPPTNAIAAGDFEGDQVWQVWDWEGRVNLSIEAFDGQAAARLGDGNGEPVACPDGHAGQLWLLRQTVAIPPEPAPVLSFLYNISAAQPAPDDAWLEVLLLIGGQPFYLVTPHELGPTSDWRLAFRDLSDWSGETAELEFRVQRCSDNPFTVNLDRVSLGP